MMKQKKGVFTFLCTMEIYLQNVSGVTEYLFTWLLFIYLLYVVVGKGMDAPCCASHLK